MTLSHQLISTVRGKQVRQVIAAHTPHRFAWYSGEPKHYHDLLVGRTITTAAGHGGMVEIQAGGTLIVLGEDVSVRFHAKGEQKAQKHQLLIEFEDESALSSSVRMYGWLLCSAEGTSLNSHHKIARCRPSPLSDAFDWKHFNDLLKPAGIRRLSAKTFLATEQRIPGLGNGVLQDILYNARIHPKRKLHTLAARDIEHLFRSVKVTLEEMTLLGGRDTEKDLFGQAGGYKTRLSRNTCGKPCGVCGSVIKKASYLGGSIYFCESCQPL